MEVLCNLRKAKAKQNKNSITIILSDTHVLSYKRHTIDITVIVISCHIYHTNLIILYYLGSPETISNRPSYRGFWYLNVRNMGRDPCSPLAAHLQPTYSLFFGRLPGFSLYQGGPGWHPGHEDLQTVKSSKTRQAAVKICDLNQKRKLVNLKKHWHKLTNCSPDSTSIFYATPCASFFIRSATWPTSVNAESNRVQGGPTCQLPSLPPILSFPRVPKWTRLPK